MVNLYRFEHEGEVFDLRVKLHADMVEPKDGREIIVTVAQALDEILKLYPTAACGEMLRRLRECCAQVTEEARRRLNEDVQRHASKAVAAGGGQRGRTGG